MIKDVRLVLILLADQLVLLRAAANFDRETRLLLGQATMTLHAPLANRLGVWQVKWELEDLAFRYLEPEKYKEIAGLLAERRADREASGGLTAKPLLPNASNSCKPGWMKWALKPILPAGPSTSTAFTRKCSART